MEAKRYWVLGVVQHVGASFPRRLTGKRLVHDICCLLGVGRTISRLECIVYTIGVYNNRWIGAGSCDEARGERET